jgi:hypothetical protein
MKFSLLGTVASIDTRTSQSTGKHFVVLQIAEPHSFKAGEVSTFEVSAFGPAIEQVRGVEEGTPVLVQGTADGEITDRGFPRIRLKVDRIANLWARAKALTGRDGPPAAQTRQDRAGAAGQPPPDAHHPEPAQRPAGAATEAAEPADAAPDGDLPF